MSASPRLRRLTFQGIGRSLDFSQIFGTIPTARKRSASPKLLAVRRIHIGLWVLAGPHFRGGLNANCRAALPKPAPLVCNILCQTSSDCLDSPAPECDSRADTPS